VTEMEHFDLAANDEPHVSLLTLKSPALVPPNVIPTMLRVTGPSSVQFTSLCSKIRKRTVHVGSA
jgi:hypothetical protein